MAEEYFHDYTLATGFERFVATMEQAMRGWLFTGLENISRMPPALGPDKQPTGYVRVASDLQQRLPWRPTPYVLSLHVPYTKEADLREQLARRRRDAARDEQRRQQQQLQQQLQQQAEQEQRQERRQADGEAEPGPSRAQTQRGLETMESSVGRGVPRPRSQQQREPEQPSPEPPEDEEHGGAPEEEGGSEDGSAQGEGGAAPRAPPSRAASMAAAARSARQEPRSVVPQIGSAASTPRSSEDAGAAASGSSAASASPQAAAAAAPSGGGAGGGADEEEVAVRLRARHAAAGGGGGREAAAGGGGGGGGGEGKGEELQQRLEDLLESFHETQKQLAQQEGAAAAAAAQRAAAAAAAATPAAAGAPGGGGAGSAADGSGGGGGAMALSRGLSRLDSLMSTAAGGLGAPPRPDARGARAAGAPPAPRAAGARRAASGAAGAGAGGSEPGSGAASDAMGDDDVTSSSVALPAPAAELRPGGTGAAVVRANLQKDASSTAASRSWWPQLAAPLGAPPRPPWWGAGAPQHKLQRWFGVDHFVLLQPRSYSKRLLDAAEASTLLSAGALALSNSRVAWPLFLPVHDALRDAYTGAAQVGSCSVYFTTDSTHVSRLPRHLRDADEQLALFAEQLAPHGPAAAAACLAARSDGGDVAGAWAGAAGLGGGGSAGAGAARYGVDLSARFTYQVPEPRLLAGGDSVTPLSEDGAESAAFDWDWSCPWSTWAHKADPIGLLELDVVWDRRPLPLGAQRPASALRSSGGAVGGGAGGGAGLRGRAGLGAVRVSELLRAGAAAAQERLRHGADGWLRRGGESGSGSGSEGAEDEEGSDDEDVLEEPEASEDSGNQGWLVKSLLAAAGDGAGGRRPRRRRSGGGEGGGGADAGAAGGGGGAAELDAGAADHWIVHVLERGLSDAPIRESSLAMRAGERARRHLALHRGGADWLWSAELAEATLHLGGSLSGIAPKPAAGRAAARPARSSAGDSTSDATGAGAGGGRGGAAPERGGRRGARGPDPGGFSTMLSALLTARTAAQAAGSVYDLAGAEWWEARGDLPPPAPPEGVMQGVLRDLFHPAARSRSGGGGGASAGAGGWAASGDGSGGAQSEAWGGGGAGAGGAQGPLCEPLPRAAARDSLLGRLAMHCMLFGNARAVALLWHRFVGDIRLQYWEARALLPRMPAAGGRAAGAAARAPRAAAGGPPAPDHNACLIQQKLQMLNLCIFRRSMRPAPPPRGGARGSAAGAGGGEGSSGSGGGGGGRGSLEERMGSSASSVAPWEDASAPWEDADADEDADEDFAGASAGSATGGASASGGAAPARALAAAARRGGAAAGGGAGSSAGSGGGGGARAGAAEGWEGEDDLDEFLDAQDDDAAAGSSNSAISGGGASRGGGGGRLGSAAAAGAPEAADFGDCFAEPGAAADAWAAPAGVLEVVKGERLLRHPERPLRVPVTLEPPHHTEDQQFEMQAALAAAHGGGGRGGGEGAVADKVKSHQSRLLVSDMSAFKAANPGCCFEDFVRWYSPNDWVRAEGGGGGGGGGEPASEEDEAPGGSGGEGSDASGSSGSGGATGGGGGRGGGALELAPLGSLKRAASAGARRVRDAALERVASSGGSGGGGARARRGAPHGRLSERMSGPHNVWRRLWVSAPAVAAAAQPPLMNARSDGEKVLHYLETLPPGPLFDQIISVALSEATAILGSCQGATLAPVARALQHFRDAASAALRRGGGGAAHAARAAAGGAWGGLAGDWGGAEAGFSDVELELLLAEFHYVEQVVVAAESLCRRLPGLPGLCERAMRCLIDGAPPDGPAARGARRRGGAARRRGGGGGGSLALAGVAFMPVAEAGRDERRVIGGWLEQEHAQQSWSGAGGRRHSSSAGALGGGGGSGGAAAGTAGDGTAPAAAAAPMELGEPSHREWVLLCSPHGSDWPAAAAAGGGGGGGAGGLARGRSSSGGGGSGGGGLGPGPGLQNAAGTSSGAAPQPPSRMYLQEADGEMRLAFTLVSQPGI